MRQAEPIAEDSGVVGYVHHLGLTALLHELVRKNGNRGAAAVLDNNRRTGPDVWGREGCYGG